MEMDSDGEEDDPVVSEIDVYHTLSLAEHLYLLQYPLRPAHLPYDPSTVVGARVSEEGGVAVDVGIRPRGENYSTSRGEGYAKMVQLGVKGQTQDQVYQSGMWDKLTMMSDQNTGDPSRYVAAVFKDGDLHLTSVNKILQLKPSISYLDQVDSGTKASRVGGANSDGETTESEGEEAVPVTVKFARQVTAGKGQSAERKKTFNESKRRDWTDVCYHGIETEEATEERRLLFATEDENKVNFELSSTAYLDLVCPMDTPNRAEEPITMPTGVLSLSQLKTLPLDQQVRKVLLNAHMVQFGHLCSLLGVTGQLGGVLLAVKSVGVLVQGCWVVQSKLLFPQPDQGHKRNARDYILWCFTQKRLVPRKEIVGTVKLSHEELREMLRPLSNMRVTPHSGWEFKLNTDLDFLNKQLVVVHEQEDNWGSRHKELVKELLVKSPGTLKHQEGKVILGDQLVKNAQKRSKFMSGETSVRKQLDLPSVVDSASVPMETSGSVQESPSEEDLLVVVTQFCRESLGRSVLSVSDLKDKLLMKQSSVSADHPLSVCGVSESLLLTGVLECGAVEVGQAIGRRMFALSHGDKVRSVVLKLLQTNKFLKKKQIIDELTAQGVPTHDKTITSCLRELCYSKGSQWRLLGTDS